MRLKGHLYIIVIFTVLCSGHVLGQDTLSVNRSVSDELLEDIGAKTQAYFNMEMYNRAEDYLEALDSDNNERNFLRELEEQVRLLSRTGEYGKAEYFLAYLISHPSIAQLGDESEVLSVMLLLYSQVLSSQVKTEAALQVLNSIQLTSVGDSLFLGDVYRTKGALYRDLGNFEESVQNYQSAIELYKREQYDRGTFQAYVGLAALNLQIDDQQRANRYFNRAEDYLTDNTDQYQVADFYSNFGVNYRQLDSLDRAKDMMLEALSIAESLGHTMLQAQNLLNIGNVYASEGLDRQAIDYYERTLALSKQEEITYGQILSYLSIGRRLYSLGEYDRSIGYYDSAAVLLSESTLPQETLTLYEYYADSYTEAGNSLKAQRYTARYESLQDSLLSAEAQNEILRSQSEFDITRQKAEIDQNLSTISRLSVYIGFTLFASVLLLCVAIWLWRRNKKLKALFERNMQVQNLPPYLQPILGEKAGNKALDNKGQIHKKHSSVAQSEIAAADEPAEATVKHEQAVETVKQLSQIFKKIIHLLEDEEIYRDKYLNIERLAQEVGTNKKYISDAISYGSNGNFYDLVNKYRINEARRLLAKPSYQDYSLDVIYEKCGYKNASTFYKNFREITGLTPAQYKKQNSLAAR
ncbi:tetratricopeptide repeat protein [Gracilimonas halophila]|uniref:Tetratricopeptide repeat protein n=1 Tax=Gracilimonas halophila TaxID=1834464 RepID=A0ABW5JHB2_9BACT